MNDMVRGGIPTLRRAVESLDIVLNTSSTQPCHIILIPHWPSYLKVIEYDTCANHSDFALLL
ncbi:hypothetical protein BABINDRAFT_161933 [Babjeviella inositovora NRRL Y-12698]|uniref:Uncharacterized protein n=1 Tax=Babjeviella inositovora NRRL Y-12698 TaxID=984486 RepID=A0A1E3QPA7_9ASCO|nr:uncharacterized protein BABINDRAFT_161933 [Babjeviella inositovora NRRL Y-12698]ODQ79546.1 hypothetical protein BABINDRAFT_161933 [Babjeviella inositovora NRRL Y-12698]